MWAQLQFSSVQFSVPSLAPNSALLSPCPAWASRSASASSPLPPALCRSEKVHFLGQIATDSFSAGRMSPQDFSGTF